MAVLFGARGVATVDPIMEIPALGAPNVAKVVLVIHQGIDPFQLWDVRQRLQGKPVQGSQCVSW